jgi:cytochrome c
MLARNPIPISVSMDIHPSTEVSETTKENFAMKLSIPQKLITISVLGVAAAAFSGASYAAVNADAAASLAKKSDCLKCHAIDKDKKASSFKKIAEKWKGKPDAEAKLMDSLTKAPKVKLLDGTEEEHKVIGTKDVNEIKNLIGWILSQ